MLIIPKKIYVGFQKRSNTLTNSLGFVTYEKPDGELVMQKSWNEWRDKSIEPLIIDNTPQTGFIVNKSVQHLSYSSQFSVEKVKIYTPMGFEFEITISNFMTIVANSDISKNYINQECVLAYVKKTLVLLPTNSAEFLNYKDPFPDLINFHKTMEESKKNKETFEIGDILQNKNELYIYLGFQEVFDYGISKISRKNFVLDNDGNFQAFNGKKQKFHILFKIKDKKDVLDLSIPHFEDYHFNKYVYNLNFRYRKDVKSLSKIGLTFYEYLEQYGENISTVQIEKLRKFYQNTLLSLKFDKNEYNNSFKLDVKKDSHFYDIFYIIKTLIPKEAVNTEYSKLTINVFHNNNLCELLLQIHPKNDESLQNFVSVSLINFHNKIIFQENVPVSHLSFQNIFYDSKNRLKDVILSLNTQNLEVPTSISPFFDDKRDSKSTTPIYFTPILHKASE